jgi:phenylalanyl-tRNA synthetase beta chain
VRLPKVAKSIDDIGSEDSYFSFTMLLKEWAYGLGLNEAVNYSFVGQSDLDHLGLPQDERIPVANPLSEDQNVLRTRLAPGLFNTLKHNLAHGATRLTIFELAKTFRADAASETTVVEPSRMGLLFYGSRRPDVWPYKGRELDFSDVRGHIDALLSRLLLPQAGYNVVKEHSYLNPCVQVTLGGELLGEAGRMDPDKADFYYARKAVWYAELDVDLLKRLHEAQHISFQSLPVFPPVRRDTTFIAPKSLQATELDRAAADCQEDLLESMVLLDVFEPEGGEERNLTYRFTYRHPDKTLKDKDVDKRHAKVLEALLKDLPLRV